MEMKNPPHPGRLLKDDIEALELSVAEAALALGVTRQQIYRVINGQSAITADMAIRLERVIGGSAGLWLRMQVGYELAQARLNKPASGLKKVKSKAA
jgi:antitoxin HigA-1